jgi:hypothetical protein
MENVHTNQRDNAALSSKQAENVSRNHKLLIEPEMKGKRLATNHQVRIFKHRKVMVILLQYLLAQSYESLSEVRMSVTIF